MSNILDRLAALMGGRKHDAPSFDDWLQLWSVAQSDRMISADDAGACCTGGLLAQPFEEESPGNNRKERLAALRARLQELTAYKWLARHQNYGDALARLNGHRLGGAYDDEAAEFRLLAAVAVPMGRYFAATQFGLPRYPKRDQVKRALKQARELRDFLSRSSALMVADKLSWESTLAIETILRELGQLERGYKEPQDPAKSLQTLTADKMAQELAKAFGKPSPALLVDLAAVLNYQTDSAHMSKRIKDLGLTAA